MTFAFETDDGQRGIFQFMATNMTSAGVNAIIRLKRPQPALRRMNSLTSNFNASSEGTSMTIAR